ncbi:MAG: hypothetical protein AMK73_09440, partial [Planctomycetes bacterium SM23_32]
MVLAAWLALALPCVSAEQFAVPVAADAAVAAAGPGGQADFGRARVTAESGRPALPLRVMRILLPPDADPDSVSVSLEGA